MCSLIIWNISKALENNPSIDLTRAIRSAHERLELESRDESKMMSQAPGDRHMTCALLAWHQLGHSGVDGLCEFIEENRHKPVCSTPDESSNNFDIERVNKSDPFRTSIKVEHKSSKNNKDVDSQIFDTQSLMGPVVKLPVETIVMRFTPAPPCQHHLKKTQKTQNDAKSLKCQNNIKNKIDAACCMDSACLQRLSELDTAVNELRSRATKLARREADRVELLERAEAAWKDLEMGFQRRLSLAEEKEDDMAKQIKKSIEERNSYKNISTNLAETLKERGDAAQQERERLRVFEKEVCDRACVRLQLSEESAKGDAALAEQLCRASQLDRDLQFKEEQARRKVTSLQSELESSQCLTYEAERAMRFELSALKEQITEVSKNLLAVEDNNNSIKVELDNFRQEKANIIEDLDGCKDICESRMKGRIDELNQKRELLKELKERVMECQCKRPQDVAVEVKRTPSLAALCHCTPEDKLLDSCSCTSLRSQLLSNLLSDLFGGLQTEMGASGLLMPCGLLLCLDDRHNWDRASVVKSSLRNFFAQLLVGELDIAIATSIEKYHAKWVGASCADTARLIPDPGEDENEGWEQRAIERRAYKLATKLAEQLFEDRAEELKQKAKDIVSSGPPPCACERHQRSPAVFPCLVKTPVTKTAHKYGEVAPSYMRRAIQDVSCLKHQLQDLKKKVDHSPTTSKAVKCPESDKTVPHDGLFHCIKADTCKCKGSVLSGPTQESKLNKYVPSNIKNKSQVYSGEVDKAQFECIETETYVLDHQNKNSRNCQGVSEDFIQDLVRKSQLFPNSCDYLVKFLGVTLTNTSSLNESKQNHDDNILNTFSKEPNDQKSMKELSFKVNMKDNNKSSKCYYSLENCVDKDVNLEKTESNINTSKLRNENDDVCVCCKNNASLETSKDLELNAFNLLEEHIKKKLGECLQSSSKSSCITSEEENELFNTILMKVKEVISESTKGLICKHCEESTNQGSWSRAYGMLQEYLKVKIKRVQCSCVSSEGHVESILPSILKKVSDLIENDFQRLKKKCKNAIDDKKNTEKIAEDKIFCNEMMITKENGKEKDSCLHLDKSCKVFDSVSTNLSTAEKEVSCEFKIYGMDCNCKHKPAESSDLDKDLIVNQYTELISINDNAIKDILSTAEMEGIGKQKIDDSDKNNKRSKPNVISKLFICWVFPVLFKGNRRDVEEDDLIIPNKPYDSDRLGEKLQRYWLDEYQKAMHKNRKPSLWNALIKAYWLSYMPGAILLLINATARTIQPLLFSELLTYWSANPAHTITRREAGFYAIGMLVLNIISAFSHHHNSLFVNRFSLKMKIACSSLIYRKVLRMSQLSIGEVAAGKLVNLLSNDVARFDMAFMFLHYLWLVPLQLTFVLYFLYDAAGYAPFVGLFSVIILVLPIQAALTKLTAVIRRVVAQRTDKRIKLMGEIINGIQVIKMYAWEKSFEKVVKIVRAFELAALRKSIFVRSVFLGFMMYAERSTLFITSLTIILSGTLLRADLIYPVKVFLGIVQINLTFILPLAIASLSELNVSLGRIQKVLVMDEREDLSLISANEPLIPVTFNGKPSTLATNSIVVRKYSTTEKLSRSSIVLSEYVVELSGACASWTKSNEEMTLKDITMNIRNGKLCAIVGSVGSGKSSLLQVLLRELPLSSGNLNVKGSLSYACQESWLFPSTVRDNILFGLPYEVERYKEVCRVCCLTPDFKQFPYGDLSLVGERGVSLSGGQKARINLARAVYREADIYLLDDPLSAVDANVGRLLFERCIQEYLSGRTRVLVTHQVHFLKSADFIVVLKEGSIKNMGSYDDLVKSEVEFSSLVSDESHEDRKTEKDNKPILQHAVSKVSVRSTENPAEEKAQVQAAEERAKGNLEWGVIKRYLESVNSWLIVFLAIFAVLVTQFGATFSDYWLSYWTNEVDKYEQSLPPDVYPDTSLGTKMGHLTTGQYLWIFGGAVLFIIIMTHVRIAGFVMMTMRASQNLHDVMFTNLIAAVMRFFNTNPSGRVLNRFSKDMGAMDEILPRSILESLQMYLFVASVLVLNALALPWTLIPTAILLVIFVFLLKWFLNAAQAVKRLESTTKSPVFGMINSTIAGLSTVRSSNSQYRLLRMFDDAQDINTSAFYTFLGGSSCFGLYLDVLCLIYLGIILAVFIFIDFGGLVEVGSVGLAVSQSLALTMILQMAARVTAELLAQMTSVERVLEYSRLPAEENMETGDTRPPQSWPSDGQVQFENVSLKYGAEDPPVLKNLNFTIQSGWKVGIVGRTGAGKSSLISALFRLSIVEGSIKIDGVETIGIPKKLLRSKISIIPQDPILFSATLRYNLDPFDHYSDDEIWRALEQVELKDAVTSLDYNVSEGGANFSAGQRQLVCLARAVLRSNKILVMDEATANVDPQTDSLIQTTIRRQFASCTVLTIAHRLNTIMDSDRILVMNRGEVAEFDHPHVLLSDPNSLLSFMVRETGTSLSGALFKTAKDKYFSENEEILKDK
ncbi:multidrug resistance-associated protein 4-like [Pararge aegeria]|uniref:multidrug resistance-associated protein 4-like n=1 Tax=Pararge aegeria TaxID=116150 RepID=UPI0019D29C6E|nr:multidrug resistance-associated protein 4-like [Pararge aegeria]